MKFVYVLWCVCWSLAFGGGVQAYELDIELTLLVDTVPARAAGGSSTGPSDAQHAVREGRRLLRLSTQTADARYLGFAKGRLRVWQGRDDVPAEIRLLQALIAQREHRFQDALVQLRPALGVPRLAAEAHLVKAMVHLAAGDPAKAIGACYSLGADVPPPVAAACLASGLNAAGATTLAWQTVKKNPLSERSGLESDTQQWVLTVYGEVASLNEPVMATQYFKRALALGDRDLYLRRVYAEHLLSTQSPLEALALLEQKALDTPSLWLKCRSLQALGFEARHRRCLAQIEPLVRAKNANNALLFPEVSAAYDGVVSTTPVEVEG